MYGSLQYGTISVHTVHCMKSKKKVNNGGSQQPSPVSCDFFFAAAANHAQKNLFSKHVGQLETSSAAAECQEIHRRMFCGSDHMVMIKGKMVMQRDGDNTR